MLARIASNRELSTASDALGERPFILSLSQGCEIRVITRRSSATTRNGPEMPRKNDKFGRARREFIA
ncbi:hypothetical protein CN934_15145 [Ensifer sp. MMN_5]|nr:hypothetical protein CN934_15145 [Ensifer sp. MMN_5]PND28083.1 hypothetical protein CN933_08280 [Sinorhizobium sp. M4_45]